MGFGALALEQLEELHASVLIERRGGLIRDDQVGFPNKARQRRLAVAAQR